MTSETFRNQGLFLRNQFQGEGIFEIPIVKKQHVNVETITLIGYDHVKPEEKEFTHAMVHFFLDDYKFEVLWNNPEPRIKKLAQYRAVLTPQYSLYTEMPMTLQLYNTFRNRWVGAYLQSRGITVIPTVCWGTPQSYWFCFDGLETGSIVTVSTLGVRTEKELFMHGYQEMIERSLLSMGDAGRIRRVVEKARAGEPVTIAYIGGSITQGAGARFHALT